jgi:hypothetical protein
MRLNWHINLPGPFSIGGPVVPRVKRRRRPARPAARPRSQAPASTGTGPGFAMFLFGLLFVILLVLAVGGFRV